MHWSHDFLEERHPLSCLRIFICLFHFLFKLKKHFFHPLWFMSPLIAFLVGVLFSIVGLCPFLKKIFFLVDFICYVVVFLCCDWMCFLFFSLHCTTKSLLIVTVGFVVCMTCGCLILCSFFIISAGVFYLLHLFGFCIHRTFRCVYLCRFHSFFFLFFFKHFTFPVCVQVLVFHAHHY